MKNNNNNREARIMMTEAELLATAELEAGRKSLTETEKWFVWTNPSLTFPEIREMLDKESAARKELALRNQKPNWPAFG